MDVLKSDIYQSLLTQIKNSCDFNNPRQILDWYFSDQWGSKQLFSAGEYQSIQMDIKQLLEGLPLEYITGTSYFLDYKLTVNESVLIPRPETEELIEWILEISPVSSRILDIGTGSGCIAIALADKIQNNYVEGWDISSKALNIAKQNASLNQVKVAFRIEDVLNISGVDCSKPFDIIVSNPPYVRPSENDQSTHHEPELALYTPEEDPLLYYRAITQFAEACLKNKGYLFFELSEFTANEVHKMVSSSSFTEVEMRKDLCGKWRMLKAKRAH